MRWLDYYGFCHGGVPGQATGMPLVSLCRLSPMTQSDEKFKPSRHFTTLISEKSHPKEMKRVSSALREREKEKRSTFLTFCRNTRWPMEKWRISPCKPLTAVLDEPLSADLSNLSFSLRYLSRLLGEFDVNTITKSFCCEPLLSSFRLLGFTAFGFKRRAAFMLTWCMGPDVRSAVVVLRSPCAPDSVWHIHVKLVPDMKRWLKPAQVLGRTNVWTVGDTGAFWEFLPSTVMKTGLGKFWHPPPRGGGGALSQNLTF